MMGFYTTFILRDEDDELLISSITQVQRWEIYWVLAEQADWIINKIQSDRYREIVRNGIENLFRERGKL